MFTVQRGKQHAIAGFNNTGQGWWNDAEVATGLRDMSVGSGSKEATLIAFSAKDHGGDAGDIAPTLRAGPHDKSHANAGVMPAVAFQANAGRDFTADEDPSPPLRSAGIGGIGGVAIAHCLNAHAGRIDGESETFIATTIRSRDGARGVDSDCTDTLIAHSLRADGFDASEDGTGRGTPLTVALRGREGGATADLGDDIGLAVRASQGGGDKAHVLSSMSVRRLLPVECEKLQGFPPGWTDITYRGKPAADGPRYRALGNSMAVPVIGWVLGRIREVAA